MRELVTAEGLCPWASRAALRLRHWRGTSHEAVQMMATEGQRLLEADRWTTCLVIFPHEVSS